MSSGIAHVCVWRAKTRAADLKGKSSRHQVKVKGDEDQEAIAFKLVDKVFIAETLRNDFVPTVLKKQTTMCI